MSLTTVEKNGTDPREAIGHCASVLGSSSPFDGGYPSTATGGVSHDQNIFLQYMIPGGGGAAFSLRRVFLRGSFPFILFNVILGVCPDHFFS